MLREIRPAILILLLLTVITGAAYPLAMTAIAGVIFPKQAQGSLIEKDGKVIGSALIGQEFKDDKYFHGRLRLPWRLTPLTRPRPCRSRTVPLPRPWWRVTVGHPAVGPAPPAGSIHSGTTPAPGGWSSSPPRCAERRSLPNSRARTDAIQA